MLKTKIVSSQQKPFIDEKIEAYPTLERISVLRGERLSFQLLYVDEGEEYIPKRPYCRLELSGALAEGATVRDVRYVPVERPIHPDAYDSNYLRITPGLYPDVLTPLRYKGKFIISRDKLRSLWIELEIPEDASGVMPLDLSIIMESASLGETGETTFDRIEISRNTLEIDVIPASLPEQELIFTQWFYADGLAGYYDEPAWSERHWRIVENFIKAGTRRGRNMIYTPILTPALNVLPPDERIPTQLVDITVTNGEYSFDFSRLGRWIDICQRAGVKYYEISHFYHQDQALHSAHVYGTRDGVPCRLFGWDTLSLDPEYVRFLRALIPALLDYMRSRGLDRQCYFHISDEPSDRYIDRYLKVKENVADLLEGYTIMDALSEVEFYKSGAVECPVPVTKKIGPFLEEDIKDRWCYYAGFSTVDCANVLCAMPSWRGRSLAMQMFKYDIIGLLHWGYNYYNNRASGDVIDPYLDLAGEDWVAAGDTFVVYPAHDGTPIESLRMITYEEIITDYRAMRLAESLTSHETVVSAMEAALGDTITFRRCATSEEELYAVRNAVNDIIRSHI